MQFFLRPFFFIGFVCTSLGVSFCSLSAKASPSDWSRRQQELRQLELSWVNPKKKITAIEIQGLHRIELSAVLNVIQSRRGEVFQPAQIKEDLIRLFDLGYFETLSAYEEETSAGAKLIYRVVERPAIAEIQFDHDDSLLLKDLQEVALVKEWSILDLAKVQEDVRLLQKFYVDRGHFLSRVSFEVVPLESKPGHGSEVKLTYRIQTYQEVQVKRLQFLNHRAFSEEELKKVFNDVQEGLFLRSGKFQEEGLKRDLQRLLFFYLDHGYLKFRNEVPEVHLSQDKRWLFLSIHLDEGDAYSVGRISFAGDLLFSDSDLRSGLLQKPGEVFKISERNQDVLALTEKYQDLGYAFVNVNPKIVLHDETLTADLTYEFEKGDLYYFREIRVKGNDKTYDKVIRRELKIHEGELFHGTRMRESKEAVERLGFFVPGEVHFQVIPLSEEEKKKMGRRDLVDLEIRVKERSTGSVNFGFGFGSVQRFFLTGMLSDTNFLGRGQILSIGGQLAAQENSKNVHLNFTEPYTFDTLWTTGGSIYYMVVPFMSRYAEGRSRYDNSRLGFDFKVGHPVAEYTHLYLTYKLEKIRDLHVDSTARPEDVAADVGLLSGVIWTLTRDRRDNRYETTGGSYQSTYLETTGLGGDFRFLKTGGDARFYRKVTKNLVFRQKGELGYIMSLSRSRITPPSQRFYLGGANSLRGYAPQEVAPYYLDQKQNLQPIGGAYQAFSMTELEHPLLKEINLKGVVFFDMGDAWSPGDRFSLKMDAGFGARIFVPFLGPIRLEWGFPINPRPQDDPSSFQFMMGPPF